MIPSTLTIFLVCATALCLSVSDARAAVKKPHVVFVTGDHEYSSERTMPLVGKALEENFGMRVTVLKAFPDEKAEDNIPGMEALATADLAVFFLRWRQLPPGQVKHIQAYLDAGKPLVGFRTSTHAFRYPPDHPLVKWNSFGEFALGAPPGWGAAGHTHYGHQSSTDVSVHPEAANHAILRGVATNFHVRSWLYHVVPQYPPPEATRLLMGRAVNPDKAAVDNPVSWTWKTKAGGRVFMTTLGHPEDFQQEAFQRLVINGLHWALSRPPPHILARKGGDDRFLREAEQTVTPPNVRCFCR